MKNKLRLKKGFTIIELIVVVAILGILVLLAGPRLLGYIEKVELARIQHDVKVMEQEVGTIFMNNDDEFNKWENNSKDFNKLIEEGKLFKKEGPVAKGGEPIDEAYKVIPEKYKDKINTKLKGTFYANSGGKVYYEHEKPLFRIPSEPEKEPVYSDEETQDLIDNNFIPIATAEELNSIRNDEERIYGKGTQWEGEYTGGLDKHYVQVLNIDLSEYSDEGWGPIGTDEESSFTGTYDGGNYVIIGLEVKGEGKNHQGLFGRTEGATISNVGLVGNKVKGENYVGGLVGRATSSTTIENSYATGSVEGSEYSIGGLVGGAQSNTKINNSYATSSVEGSGSVGGLVGEATSSTNISKSYATGSVIGGSSVGGLVGYAHSEIIINNSYATGSVEGSGSVGGLVGGAYSGTNISNSYAKGSVTGTGESVGGLVGYAYSEIIINNSYATGSVEGSGSVGGLMGGAYDGTNISKSYATGSVIGGSSVGGLVGYSDSAKNTIENSYATGSATGSGTNVGGLVGSAYDGIIENSYATGSIKGSWNEGGLVGHVHENTKISNSYWDTKTTGQKTSAGEGEGKSTDEMKKQTTYSGWDFDTIWQIDEGVSYPILR